MDDATERHEHGMRVRREVLGDAHVDAAVAATTHLDAAFQDYITGAAWADVWARPGLDRATRSLVTIALVAFLGAGLTKLIFALCIIGWVGYARLIRGQVLKVREYDFVQAARALGANPVEKIQDTLGIWGLRLLLVTLAVTPFRVLGGWPRLQLFRRMLGLFAFFYISLHFLWYLFVDQAFDWSQLLADVVKRPYVTAGFTAFLLLVPLAATSTQRAMRRLGRRWQKLHRLVYAAAILGCVHFWWQVKADTREPLVYAAIATLLLGWRLHRAWRRRRDARENRVRFDPRFFARRELISQGDRKQGSVEAFVQDRQRDAETWRWTSAANPPRSPTTPPPSRNTSGVAPVSGNDSSNPAQARVNSSQFFPSSFAGMSWRTTRVKPAPSSEARMISK